jgi:hypothetical protein
MTTYEDIAATLDFTADEFELIRELLANAPGEPNNLGYQITLKNLAEKFGVDIDGYC